MSSVPPVLSTAVDAAKALAALRNRERNYDPAEVRRPDWNFDAHRAAVADEPPGPPTRGGPWEVACELVRDYEFTPPELVRAVYDRDTPLLGRNVLLEARFAILRFWMGVRITSVVEESDETHDVWGWGYETLQGHLERGEVVYRVIKHRNTGRVEFTASSVSQADPELGPILRTGWALFGRHAQLRFYRKIGRRISRLVGKPPRRGPGKTTPADPGVARVPSGARRHLLDRLALHVYEPVRSRLA